MWKLLAKTSVIMERIPKHSFGLFTILLFIIDLNNVQCGTVRGEDQTGQLGDNPLTLTCAFTVGDGEVAWSMTISKKSQSGSLTNLASFNILGNQSSYSDPSIQGRTTLILLEDSANIRYNSLQCGDQSSYQCYFVYTRNSLNQNDEDDMSLAIEATPVPPVTISSGFNPNSKVFVEGEELEMRCQGDVGRPVGNIMWFTYSDGNGAGVDVTSKSIPGNPVANTGPRYCTFRRESTLKLNLTRSDNKMVIRCVLNHTTLGSPPTQNDVCQDDTCKQTGNIEVQYPIREEDMAISSNPKRNEYIVGSDVTMTCTVDGNPAPYFRWEKTDDDSVSREGENSWILTNLQLGQGGTYSCFANNTVNGVTYNATKSININVVETTTSSTTTSTTTTSPANTGGGVTEPVVTGGTDNNTTTIIIICVVIGVLLIIAAIVAFIIVRRKRAKDTVEEPPEKPFNKNNMSMYNTKPDLVRGDEKKLAHNNYKNEEGLTYADLKFDDKPRSRRPVALADNMTDYADITIPQV